MDDLVFKEMTKDKIEQERKNEYKIRVVQEYRDIIEKRVKLEKYLVTHRNAVQTETQANHIELLDKQLQVMNEYEEILYMRIRFMLTE